MDVRSEWLPANGGRIEGTSPLTTHLALPALLVREAVQNSWDARDPERTDPVSFSVVGRTLRGPDLQVLRSLLPLDGLPGFVDDEADGGSRSPAETLATDEVDILVIADRGTVGLLGPTRNVPWPDPRRLGNAWPSSTPRFANFIRNSGRAPSEMGRGDGGSYGLGKSVLWRASRCGTILVHSRTTDADGNSCDRLIGSVLGDPHEDEDHLYTGRHFVGAAAEDDPNLIEPVVGDLARAVVADLGLPPYDGFGTTIVIVAPRFRGLENMIDVRDSLRWHCWPHLVPGIRSDTSGPDMVASVGWENTDLSPRDLADDIELQPYADALRDALVDRSRASGEPVLDIEIECGRPRKHLGWLRLREADSRENVAHISDIASRAGEDGEREPIVPFGVPYGHVAFIRREPLLLVTYRSLPHVEQADRHYGGVFLSAEDEMVERSLTASEPPAHDDWIHEQVDRTHSKDYRKRFVKRTVEELRTAMRRFGKALEPEPAASSGAADLSRRVTSGLDRLGGAGGAVSRRKGAGAGVGGTSGPLVGLTAHPERRRDLVDFTEHYLTVSLTPSAGRFRVTASASARDSDGVVPTSEPDGIVVLWDTPAGEIESASIEVDDPEQLGLLIRVRGDARVRPNVRAEQVLP